MQWPKYVAITCTCVVGHREGVGADFLGTMHASTPREKVQWMRRRTLKSLDYKF